MKFEILLLYVFFICESCVNIHHDIVYYENGTKKYDIEYKNGKIDGNAKYWDVNGDLINVVSYNNDLFHGKWIDYYSNGNIQHSINYTFGQKHGEETWYYESGNIKSRIIYEYDKIINDLIRWDQNGVIINHE